MGEGAACLWLAFQTSSLHKITSWEDNLWACDNLFRLTFLQCESHWAVEGKCRRPMSVCWLVLPRDTRLTVSAAAAHRKKKDTPLHLICASTFTTSLNSLCLVLLFLFFLFFFIPNAFFIIHITAQSWIHPSPLCCCCWCCSVKLKGGWHNVEWATVWCGRRVSLWCFGGVSRNVPFDGPVSTGFLCFLQLQSARAWRLRTSHQGHNRLCLPGQTSC